MLRAHTHARTSVFHLPHTTRTDCLMKGGRTRVEHYFSPRALLMVSMIVTLSMIAAAPTAAAAAAASCNIPAAAGAPLIMKTQPAFMAGPSTCHHPFGAFRHSRRRGPSGGGGVAAAQAMQSGPGSNNNSEEARRGDDGGVAVHDDSWYLGDGGFAKRHLEDEALLAAKKVKPTWGGGWGVGKDVGW